MKKNFFAIFLAMTIGFYSCQKEEENAPIDNNNVNKGVKKMTTEDEAIYNSIVDFREKLLTKDYVVGESISTEKAILLMEASLNLTYRNNNRVEGELLNLESSVSVDRDFNGGSIEYSKIYITYEDVLNSVRNVYANIEENDKKVRIIDLELNLNNTISINTFFEVGTTTDAPAGTFDAMNEDLTAFLIREYFPTTCMYGDLWDVETDSVPDSDLPLWLMDDLRYNPDQYLVHGYFVNVYVLDEEPYHDFPGDPLLYADTYGGFSNIGNWFQHRDNLNGSKRIIEFELGKIIILDPTTYPNMCWCKQSATALKSAQVLTFVSSATNPIDIIYDY